MTRKRTIALGLFALFSALYIRTMCPTVYLMDNGELIVAAYKFKIAHQTGYPLFCILGKLSTILIPFGSIVLRVNAMNAVLAAATVAVLFLALSEIARKRYALFAAALFGISPIFWDAATSAEVHALNILIISIELLLFLMWRRRREKKLLCYLALAAGFGLTNHLTSALVLPGILYGVYRDDKSVFRNSSLIVKAALCILLPLSLYVYLPLRAEASRGTIWGDLYASTGFIKHVTGHAFRNLMFHSTPSEIWDHILQFLKLVIDQYPIYLAWALGLGVVLLNRQRVLGAFLIMLVVTVGYNINYGIVDIESYYLPSMLVLAFFTAVGVQFVMEQANRSPVRLAANLALAAVLIVVCIAELPVSNKSNAQFVMDYTQNLMKTLDEGALYIACGDASYNAMQYEREVEGKRPDLTVIHRNILRAWSQNSPNWTARYYFDSVSENSNTLRAFRWPFDYSRRDVLLEKYLYDIVALSIKERAVYIGCIGDDYDSHPIVKRLKDGFELIPEGIVYRVYPKSEKIDPMAVVKLNERLWGSYQLRRIYDGSIVGGEIARETPDRYASFHVALADFELKNRMYDRAEKSFENALLIDENQLRARNGLAISLVCRRKYREAAAEWKKVLAKSPKDKTAISGLRMVQSVLESSK